ncbi:MAG: hypothetical protein ISN29_04290 [Gammaproteobacteria bacterium AqS3]|nr:hypothetical protein [Gammaproteobacteria bacterium AqS3]
MKLQQGFHKGIWAVGLLLLLAGCSDMPRGEIELTPWRSLTSDEIARAAEAVRSDAGEGVLLFNRISLAEPNKARALAWSPGETPERSAEIAYGHNGIFYLARVDLATGAITSKQPARRGTPRMSSEGEVRPVIETIMQDARILQALSKRGAEPENVLCLPRPLGQFYGGEDAALKRLVKVDCTYIAGDGMLGLPSGNIWARPIEDLSILYSLATGEILQIDDTFQGDDAPPFKLPTDEFSISAIPPRAQLAPVHISRPNGRNFTIADERIAWQGWSFHLRFDARQGTILNNVEMTQPGADPRRIAYEIAMSEMFVPYQDETLHHFYKAYFDMGELGFGLNATPLQKADCPRHAVMLDVVLHSPAGEPSIGEDRICVFEHDPGIPMWRHHEAVYDGIPGLQPHESRPAVELVVRMVATLGNYDYFQDYVFQQDGRLRIRLTSTGIDAVKAVRAVRIDDPSGAEDTRTGALIAPHRIAMNHDHFFNYRIDLDIDGLENNFHRHRLRTETLTDNPYRMSVWRVEPNHVKTERAAETVLNPETPAALTLSSSARQNRMGYPTGYQIMMKPVRPLVDLRDPQYSRAMFLRSNLWVTRYKPDEIYAAGAFVSNSDPGQGLPEFIADDESLVDADLVAWATMGFHHIPVAEDWPVLPAKMDQIILKPRNFYDRSPAADLNE